MSAGFSRASRSTCDDPARCPSEVSSKSHSMATEAAAAVVITPAWVNAALDAVDLVARPARADGPLLLRAAVGDGLMGEGEGLEGVQQFHFGL